MQLFSWMRFQHFYGDQGGSIRHSCTMRKIFKICRENQLVFEIKWPKPEINRLLIDNNWISRCAYICYCRVHDVETFCVHSNWMLLLLMLMLLFPLLILMCTVQIFVIQYKEAEECFSLSAPTSQNLLCCNTKQTQRPWPLFSYWSLIFLYSTFAKRQTRVGGQHNKQNHIERERGIIKSKWRKMHNELFICEI